MCTVSEQTLSVLTPTTGAPPGGTEQPRVLAFSGLVCAMAIVLESLPIYLMGPSLKIYFIFGRLAGMQLLRPGRGHDGRCHH